MFNLYNVTCVCVFRANHLALGSQLVCSSLRGTSSFIPDFPQLPIVLCLGWGLEDFSPSILACPLVLFIWTSYVGSHVGETLRV